MGLHAKATGISFQPATYSGRHVLPDELEQRITFPDVIKGVAKQTGGIPYDIDPDVALAMVRLGLNLEGVATSLDLEEGFTFLEARTKSVRRR
jgi:hypothetical protein